MEKEQIGKKIELSKKIIIIIFLSIWCLIPFFNTILPTSYTIDQYKYLKIVGLIGIYFLIIYISKNSYKKEERKEFCKKILPIFIFGLYMLWTLISSIFSEDINKAFYGTGYRKEGYITYLAYAGFFSLAFLLDCPKSKKSILNIFLLVAIVNCIISQIAESFRIANLLMVTNVRIGVFLNSNHYGYYLLMATMCANFLFVTEKNKVLKILYLLSYIFLLYYLIFNNTLGCYLAIGIVLIGFLLYCIGKKKMRCVSIISFVIFIIMSCIVHEGGQNLALNNIKNFTNDISKVFSVIFQKDNMNEVEEISKLAEVKLIQKDECVASIELQKKKELQDAGTGRMDLWINATKFFIERPILGYGPENLGVKYAEIGCMHDRPHDLILQLATTSGLPGLILYLVAIRTNYSTRN